MTFNYFLKEPNKQRLFRLALQVVGKESINLPKDCHVTEIPIPLYRGPGKKKKHIEAVILFVYI